MPADTPSFAGSRTRVLFRSVIVHHKILVFKCRISQVSCDFVVGYCHRRPA
nr:MAG TPA: hypothetical protein [Caudoviricetes sp.]